MRISALCTAVVAYVVIGHPPPAVAQVDQQRAQEYFKEAQALCERDGGRLWGVSICAPMVIGDSADADDRHQPAATGRASPTAHRSGEWADSVGRHDVGGAHLGHDRQLAGSHARRGVRPRIVSHRPAQTQSQTDRRERTNIWIPVDGRYWLRLEWRALARALRESAELRAQAVRDALAFRQARHTRYPDKVESERALYITEGFASYTQTVLAAPSQADAIARGLELLAGAEDGESFVRTFTYTSGPAYGLLLDASSPGWTRTARGSDDPPAMLMRALGVQPVADAAAAAARYGGAELRAAEEQREQQRQARIAELRQRFVDGPVFVMPCGGSGTSNSLGAVVIPDAGTVLLPSLSLVGTLRHARGGERRARGVRWPLAAAAGARARRRRDDLRRRLDVQGGGGLGGARRRTEGRLRSRPAAA